MRSAAVRSFHTEYGFAFSLAWVRLPLSREMIVFLGFMLLVGEGCLGEGDIVPMEGNIPP